MACPPDRLHRVRRRRRFLDADQHAVRAVGREGGPARFRYERRRDPHLAKAARSRSPTLTIMISALISPTRWPSCFRSPARSDHGFPVDVWILSASLLLFAIPTACLAVSPGAARAIGHRSRGRGARGGLLVSPLGQGRALLAEVDLSDYIRNAHALGMSPVRIAFRHALRNAALPLVALASVEMPTALRRRFVVEKAFGISGLGEETVRAVQTHDVAWLVGLAFVTALTVTLTRSSPTSRWLRSIPGFPTRRSATAGTSRETPRPLDQAPQEPEGPGRGRSPSR